MKSNDPKSHQTLQCTSFIDDKYLLSFQAGLIELLFSVVPRCIILFGRHVRAVFNTNAITAILPYFSFTYISFLSYQTELYTLTNVLNSKVSTSEKVAKLFPRGRRVKSLNIRSELVKMTEIVVCQFNYSVRIIYVNAIFRVTAIFKQSYLMTKMTAVLICITE